MGRVSFGPNLTLLEELLGPLEELPDFLLLSPGEVDFKIPGGEGVLFLEGG